jgi:arabinan endo-1,5-alpha-L-arabinosidase
VVTDSIKSTEVAVELKDLTGGKLSIRDGKKDGTVLSECELVGANAKSNAKGWTTVACSNLKSIGGVKDFYLTASGVSGETIVRNIVFASSPGEIVCNQEPCGDPISSSSSVDSAGLSSSSEIASILSSSSGTDAIVPRAIRHDSQTHARKAFRDLKGRAFDRQIPYRVMF